MCKLLHEDAQPRDIEVERAAHRFAAEFLAPATSIRRSYPTDLDWPKFAELKVRSGVSIAVLLRAVAGSDLHLGRRFRSGHSAPFGDRQR